MSQVVARASASREPSAALVHAQLNRILSSDIFSRSGRLSALLRFIVQQTLDGKGDTLKEQVIAIELYGKGPDFNAAADPIVRVDARRLRDHLREYYASSARDAVLISVPKGSYAPLFEINPLTVATPDSVVAAPVEPRPRSLRPLWMGGAGVVLIAATAWLAIGLRMRLRSEPSPIRMLTVTSLPGSEGGPPALSPDGNLVVFAWTGPDSTANGDLWLKAVEGDALRRLTDTPEINEVFPQWSPDGQQIAFTRADESGSRGIYVISPLGGSERKITDSGWRPTWLPDSRSFVFHDRAAGRSVLIHYVLATGARRQLTTPPTGFIDRTAKVSPDGKTVAFVRSTPSQPFGGASMAALFVVPTAGGDPRRLDDWVSMVGLPEWTPDGREILYPRWSSSGAVTAFRIAATGGAAAPAAGLPSSAYAVSTSGLRPGGTFRVAVVNARSDVGLRMINLQGPKSHGRLSAWQAFCDSTRLDWPGRFSRDGTQLAFTSDRNGPAQIFVANRDGSQTRTVTAFDGISVGLASWSPDGQFLVFDAVDSTGLNDLYVAGIAGGPLRRLTHDATRETDPEWSRDGRWIYYGSDASSRSEISKIPAAGGRPVQLTTQGGMDARASPDGKDVYFLAPAGDSPFMAVPTVKRVSVDGGDATTVMSGVRPGRWDIADDGIVFLTDTPGLAPDPANADVLELFSFKDGRTRRLGDLPFPVMKRGYSPPRVLAVSPDGRWVVVSHMDAWERDIVVADNFR
jgi:Tol biopolymer transport system component